jgi:hypothetical protein
MILGQFACNSLEGIAASLYPVFNITKSISNKKKKKPVSSQSTFFARPWRVSGLRLVPCFGCFVDLFSGRSLVGSFLGYFIAGGLFFQRVSNRETEELTRSVDDLRSCAGSPANGTRDGSEHACQAGTLLSRNHHTAVSFLSNDLRDRIRQILGLPSLVVTGAVVAVAQIVLIALFGATSLDLKPEVKKELFEA